MIDQARPEQRDDLENASQILVSGVSKIYKVYWGPRSLLKELIFGIPSHHRFAALENIDFRIEAGESFGVVGNNGAGKSTLLKLLAGTTFPTAGQTRVRGSVSALLELGTGFHPEFTGRQNIYFSGALAGYPREQIREKEGEIIRFSELEAFIDKPVKTYSTGMYLRLGFATAIGFDPDVLIIDEALAVGDQNFQKKCTDRILAFREKGVTILFCSHNLHQVKTLCDRAIWLHEGRSMAVGRAAEVVDRYNDFCRQGSIPGELPERKGERIVGRPPVCWIEDVKLRDLSGKPRYRFSVGESMVLDVKAHFSPDFQGRPAVGIGVVRNDGLLFYTASSALDRYELRIGADHRYRVRLVLPEVPLLSGSYYFNVATTDQYNLQAYDAREKVEPFTMVDGQAEPGLVRLVHRWETPDAGGEV